MEVERRNGPFRRYVALHPWNTGFTWHDRVGPFRRLSAEQVRQFDSLGFIVLDGLFADLCHDLVGRDVRLHHDQAVYKKPEKPRTSRSTPQLVLGYGEATPPARRRRRRPPMILCVSSRWSSTADRWPLRPSPERVRKGSAG